MSWFKKRKQRKAMAREKRIQDLATVYIEMSAADRRDAELELTLRHVTGYFRDDSLVEALAAMARAYAGRATKEEE